jgi:hypothetical protein
LYPSAQESLFSQVTHSTIGSVKSAFKVLLPKHYQQLPELAVLSNPSEENPSAQSPEELIHFAPDKPKGLSKYPSNLVEPSRVQVNRSS